MGFSFEEIISSVRFVTWLVFRPIDGCRVRTHFARLMN